MLDRPAQSRGIDRHRRARSTVFAFLGAWIATQAILVGLIENGPWLRDPLYSDKEDKLRQRIIIRSTDGDRPKTIVVVGSSRVNLAVRGEFVENALEQMTNRRVVVFNFGVPAAGPIANRLAVHRLVRSDVRPDLIILEVLPPLIAGQRGQPPELRNLVPERLLLSEHFLANSSGVDWSDCNRRWWTAELVPCYGLRFQLLGRVLWPWRPWNLQFKNSRDTDATGWTRSMRQSVDRSVYQIGVEQAWQEYGELLDGLNCCGAAAQAVRESLAECRRYNVRAAILLTPEGSEFRSWYPQEAKVNLSRFLDELQLEYAVPIIDARTWRPDSDFADSHHLLPSAAGAFSTRLGQAIEAMERDSWALPTSHPKTASGRRD